MNFDLFEHCTILYIIIWLQMSITVFLLLINESIILKIIKLIVHQKVQKA